MQDELLGLGVDWIKYWTNFLYEDYKKIQHEKQYPIGFYANPNYEEQLRQNEREGYYGVPLNPYGPGGNLETYRQFRRDIERNGRIRTDRRGNPIIVPLTPAREREEENIPLIPLLPAGTGAVAGWPIGLKIKTPEVGVYGGKYVSSRPYNRGPNYGPNPAFSDVGGFN